MVFLSTESKARKEKKVAKNCIMESELKSDMKQSSGVLYIYFLLCLLIDTLRENKSMK